MHIMILEKKWLTTRVAEIYVHSEVKGILSWVELIIHALTHCGETKITTHYKLGCGQGVAL